MRSSLKIFLGTLVLAGVPLAWTGCAGPDDGGGETVVYAGGGWFGGGDWVDGGGRGWYGGHSAGAYVHPSGGGHPAPRASGGGHAESHPSGGSSGGDRNHH
jgi:hypothetical protein